MRTIKVILIDNKHSFHMVHPAPCGPWILMSFLALFSVVVHFKEFFLYSEDQAFGMLFSLSVLFFNLFRWFGQISLEVSFLGPSHNTHRINNCISIGIKLFIFFQAVISIIFLLIGIEFFSLLLPIVYFIGNEALFWIFSRKYRFYFETYFLPPRRIYAHNQK